MNRIVSVIAAVGIGVTAGSMVLFITLPMLTAWWRTAYETQLQTVLSVNDSVEQYAPITEAVVQQHPAPATVTGSCPADYERLFHEEFSLCYPSFFERMENEQLALEYDDSAPRGKIPDFEFVDRDRELGEFYPESDLPDSGDPDVLRNNIIPDSNGE